MTAYLKKTSYRSFLYSEICSRSNRISHLSKRNGRIVGINPRMSPDWLILKTDLADKVIVQMAIVQRFEMSGE